MPKGSFAKLGAQEKNFLELILCKKSIFCWKGLSFLKTSPTYYSTNKIVLGMRQEFISSGYRGIGGEDVMLLYGAVSLVIEEENLCSQY